LSRNKPMKITGMTDSLNLLQTAWFSAITPFVTSSLSCIWQWLNSNLSIAFIGGLTGAFGGAVGAQRIVERSKQRDELLRELRNTNAATMVAFSVCNAALATKKQHAEPLRTGFYEARAALLKFQAERASGQRQGNTEYHVSIDLRVFPAPVVPLETLKNLVFEKLSAVGRPLALVSTLEQSLACARDALVKRELLVQRFASGAIPENLTAQFYFGQKLPNGHLSQEHPDLVEGIYRYMDDIGFFSALLCTDLMAHGNRLHAAFTKRFGKGAPPVSTVDFSGPRKSGLIPPDSQYNDWLRAFTETEGAPSAEVHAQ
jgi:hypothetical protein